ncbi:unnamed protein product [Discosporangium mesarthrocarpum]
MHLVHHACDISHACSIALYLLFVGFILFSKEAEPVTPKATTAVAGNKVEGEVKTKTEEVPAERLEEAETEAATDAGEQLAEEVDDGQPTAVDRSVQRVQSRLASMLDRLEQEIDSVEKRIGDKMHILDRDLDGMVTAEELAFVIQHTLSTHNTAEEAKELADLMDTDCDGQISVKELINWVKAHADQTISSTRSTASSTTPSLRRSSRNPREAPMVTVKPSTRRPPVGRSLTAKSTLLGTLVMAMQERVSREQSRRWGGGRGWCVCVCVYCHCHCHCHLGNGFPYFCTPHGRKRGGHVAGSFRQQKHGRPSHAGGRDG